MSSRIWQIAGSKWAYGSVLSDEYHKLICYFYKNKRTIMVKEARIVYQADAEKQDINFWKKLSAEEKLSTVQYLREQYINLFNKQDEYAESRKRLRRFYRIIK